MIIEIVFGTPQPKETTQLITLLGKATDKLCQIYISDTSSGNVEKWASDQSEAVRFEWEKALAASLKVRAKYKISPIRVDLSVAVSDWGNDPAILCLSDAVDLVNRPKSIYVENARNDRKFLLTIVDENLRARVLDMESRSQLQFSHGGGIDELTKLLEEHVKRFPLTSMTSLAFFDGDAPSPNNPQASAIKLSTLCQSNGINFHCLARRAIENYIPLEKIREWSDRSGSKCDLEKVNVFTKLSPSHRNHFHMKNGLDNQACKRSSSDYNLPKDELAIIAKGFGGISKLYPDDGAEPDGSRSMHKLMKDEGTLNEFTELMENLKKIIEVPE